MEDTKEFAESLDHFDRKLNRLRLDYEQYFLGSRPREPIQLRQELQKFVSVHSQMPVPNSALRFRFSSLCARFQAMKRKWDATNRQIEAGTYERHRFKARMREHERSAEPASSRPGPRPGAPAAATGDELFRRYRAAREKLGLSTADLTRERFDAALARQRAQLRDRFGDSDFGFRVEVKGGAVKLKATRRSGGD